MDNKRLGKGLGALISEDVSKAKEKIERVKLADIVPNPFQPRKKFKSEKMTDLMSSIKEKGVIQPILVRPKDEGYEIIAGERRWKAAQELKLEEIPVIVRRDIDDANSLEISLIENIQREELNPMEEANAYKELQGKFSYTLDKIGQMMGKDKTTISNTLRLLALPEKMKTAVEDGEISAGHAKALLSIPSEYRKEKIYNLILKKGLSVRETEQMSALSKDARRKTKKDKMPEILDVEEKLQHFLGTKVNIIQGKKRGRIEIQYFSLDDLSRLLNIILPE